MHCFQKRIVSVVTVIVFVISTFVAQIPFIIESHAVDTEIKWTEGIEGGAIYFNKETGIITDLDWTITKLTIPKEIEGVEVKGIEGGIKANCFDLEHIVVSDDNPNFSVENGVLFNKNKTKLIFYPQGLEDTEYEIPNGVIAIDDFAFGNCDNLKNIVIPSSVETIGEAAFLSSGLNSVDIPEGVTTIGKDSFTGSNISKVTIPSSVSQIEDRAFTFCNDLQEFQVNNDNINYSSSDGILFNKNKTILIQYPLGNGEESYEVPSCVETIEMQAFASIGNVALSTITILNNVKKIGSQAFFGYENLTIYGYEGSYIQTYARDNNIPFAIIGEDIKNSGSLNLTEDDLFGEYANYLYNNETYNALLWNLYDTFDDASYKTSNDLSSAVKLAMRIVGEFDAIRYIKLMAGIDDTDEEIAEELALEIIRGAENDSGFEKNILGEVESYYDWTSNTYGIVSNGFKTERQKKDLAELLGSGYLYSKSSALDFIKDVESEWAEIDKTFKAAGFTINSAQFVSEIVMTMEANHLIVTTLMDSVPKDSVLYEGLKSVEQEQKGSLTENLAKKFIEDGAIEEIAGALIEKGLSYGSAYFKPVGLCFVVASEFIPVSADDKVKALIADANCATLSMAVKSKAVEISQDYKNNNGKNKEKLKAEYKLIFDAYMQSIKSYKEYAYATADSQQKEDINREYNITKKYLSYDKYIESCLRNANTSWKYQVKNDKAVITGMNSEKAEAQRFAFLENLFAEPAYAAGSGDVLLGIPDKVDGYEVAEVGKNAIKQNEELYVIYIPDSVNKIGESAFSGCTSLNKVLMSRSVDTIEANAFSGCDSIAELELLSSVKNIGEGAFDGVNSIKALPGSTGAEYADKNNLNFVEKSLKYVDLEIVKEPDKLSYNMDEELDVTGIKVVATGEDRTTKDVSDNIYYEFEDKKIGENKVNVYFNDLSASYKVNILAGETQYTVSYEDEFGNEIAPKYEAMASVGEDVELPIPEITGYIVDEQVKTRTIGADNAFVITYTSVPKRLISDAEISCVKEAEYTGKQIKPDIKIIYGGITLVQDEDYTIDYDENTEPGLGGILIRGIGDYSGYAWIDFDIKKASDTGDVTDSSDGDKPEPGDSGEKDPGNTSDKVDNEGNEAGVNATGTHTDAEKNSDLDKAIDEHDGAETGDNSDMLILICLLALSMIGIISICIAGRKRKHIR